MLEHFIRSRKELERRWHGILAQCEECWREIYEDNGWEALHCELEHTNQV